MKFSENNYNALQTPQLIWDSFYLVGLEQHPPSDGQKEAFLYSLSLKAEF